VAVGITKRADETPLGCPVAAANFEASTELDSETVGLLLQHVQRRIESLRWIHSKTAYQPDIRPICNLRDLWNDLWPEVWAGTDGSRNFSGDPASAESISMVAPAGDRPPASPPLPVLPPVSSSIEGRQSSACANETPGKPGAGFIAFAESMTAEELRHNCRIGAVGVILDRCSWHSDTMLLARSLGIPLVCGLGAGIRHITNDMPVVLDGTRGLVYLSDSPDLHQCHPIVPGDMVSQPELPDAVPAVTRDGITIRMLITLEFRQSVDPQLLSVADGIGLWRSDRSHWHNPTPETASEFLEIYRQVADRLPGQELQIVLCKPRGFSRNFQGRDRDVGGFNSPPGPRLHHADFPALAPREWLVPQVQALAELAKQHPVTMLLSAIDCRETLESAISALLEMIGGVDCGSLPFRIGVLLECPSLALTAREWLPLIHGLTIDWDSFARSISGLEDWQSDADPLTIGLAPPVLRLLHELAGLSRDAGIPLTLCGHLLGNPKLTAAALAVGIRRLSVSPWSFRSAQRTICEVSGRGLGEFQHLVSSQASAPELNHWLQEHLPT
jgi:phosphoenolpyruvate-protein kinase (PTS system EI component)